MNKEGITPLRFFKQADKNFNMVLTVEELKDQVKVTLPDAFAGLNFKKLSKALDVNNNGVLEQQEFVDVLEEAAGFDSNTSNLNKISSSVAKANPVSAEKPKPAARTLPQSNLLVRKQTMSSKSKTLEEAVKPQHRMKHDQIIEVLKKLIQAETRIETPIDEIQAIFEKIRIWKEKAGDLDQQEKMVSKKLRPVENISIHNYKTAELKLLELKGDIGFTNDDIMIILMTSLDLDYFTNLIVA